MAGLSGTEMLVLIGAGTLFFGGKRLPELAKALREAFSNFRGGGPTMPSHPLPADDSALLTRRPSHFPAGR
jgi:Sec-independent protein translocase protein TatA